MNELKLKLKGQRNFRPTICVDGKAVKFKKNKFGSIETKVATEKNSVEITIYKHLEIKSKLYILWYILYFFISIFGIFDVREDKKCIVYDCKFKVELNGTTSVDLTFNTSKDEAALAVESEANVEEIKNVTYVDQEAKKRMKIILGIKIALWVALGITAITLLLIKLI
ncbi:MAG: hypothetical protein IJ008_02010 [Clostridia bacterium]|nr:hypothetical protein [Clostridia bacterium]